MQSAYIPVSRCLDPGHDFASLKRSKSFRVRFLHVFASGQARGLLIAELDGVMRSQRGFTLLELVVVVGVAGVITAVAVPRMAEVVRQNKVITSTELVAATFREARLAAISRNSRFRVLLGCDGGFRFVAVTGNAAIDNAADRCSLNQPNDGPLIRFPEGVVFGGGVQPAFEISGRGQVGLVGGGNMPQTVSVAYGTLSRNIVITAAGRVRTPTD